MFGVSMLDFWLVNGGNPNYTIDLLGSPAVSFRFGLEMKKGYIVNQLSYEGLSFHLKSPGITYVQLKFFVCKILEFLLICNPSFTWRLQHPQGQSLTFHSASQVPTVPEHLNGDKRLSASPTKTRKISNYRLTYTLRC